MDNQILKDRFTELSTSLIADACLRLEVPLSIAPPGIFPVSSDYHIAGHVLPVRHSGSVDIFLEAMGGAQKGDILVIDNDGRRDEGCIGDLIVLEAQACGLAGILVWGAHRDTAELMQIGFPVFSYGNFSAGPTRLDPRAPDALDAAYFGKIKTSKADVVFADADGALFVPSQRAEEVLSMAQGIFEKERWQAQAIQACDKLRDQLRFSEYLERRTLDPAYTFREHLRQFGGAIEE